MSTARKPRQTQPSNTVVKPRSGVPGGRFSVGRQARPFKGVRALGRGVIGGQTVSKEELEAAIHRVVDSTPADQLAGPYAKRIFWPGVVRALGLKSVTLAELRAGAKLTNYGCSARALFCRLLSEPEVPSVSDICARVAAARTAGTSLFPPAPAPARTAGARAGNRRSQPGDGGRPAAASLPPEAPSAPALAEPVSTAPCRQQTMPFSVVQRHPVTSRRCGGSGHDVVTKGPPPMDAMHVLLTVLEMESNAVAMQDNAQRWAVGSSAKAV